MPSTTELLASIKASPQGVTLAELLTLHPSIARRTAQRQIAKLIDEGLVIAHGEGRARRYFGVDVSLKAGIQTNNKDAFSAFIPVSADSQDILNYINLPLEARKPVGYQLDFLNAYQPNKTWYLSESLRRQLHKMGKTTDSEEPAGTYSRAILNRLLIDLSWASSHLEGNTYSRYALSNIVCQTFPWIIWDVTVHCSTLQYIAVHCSTLQYICSNSLVQDMATSKSATLTFRVDPGLKEALRVAAEQERRSLANMVEIMIRKYCDEVGVRVVESAPLQDK